ncbi:DUF1002 domain-containing protein [Candidatus Enterococcus willemsii]|uniref:DUF1002 domain-containing protein n=1 Tax=Candidatus Enterococcus willemsii TaxID=1857215 RepID=A0ABQ6YX87_9ENTE|nr:DUF1002 domain-containing protein [Enterococcus sp. CU12B]KAF1302434.1 hypothetical protein BAU17_09265 [Enterococcus sp. CU12B]
MMYKKLLTSVLVGATVLPFALATNVAADTQAKTKDEGWDVPNVALGNGLTEQEQQDTLAKLKVTDKAYNTFTVNGDDLVKYVTDIDSFTSDSKAYSSAYMMRTKEGSGVNVSIETPETITSRTEANYRNAAITSGVYDADIRIASVRVMDGSGALAGIYKIYDEVEPAANDAEAQERAENREVAQEESAVVSEITTENQDNENFSDDNLAVALAEIKLELQKIKDELAKLNEAQGREKVKEVVVEQMNGQGLGDVLTDSQIDSISNTMYNFSQAPVINNEQITEQLTTLKDDLMQNGKDFIDNAKEKLNSEETKGFFANLWQTIKSFFEGWFN